MILVVGSRGKFSLPEQVVVFQTVCVCIKPSMGICLHPHPRKGYLFQHRPQNGCLPLPRPSTGAPAPQFHFTRIFLSVLISTYNHTMAVCIARSHSFPHQLLDLNLAKSSVCLLLPHSGVSISNVSVISTQYHTESVSDSRAPQTRIPHTRTLHNDGDLH